MPSMPKKRPKQGSRSPKPVSEPKPPSSSSSSFSSLNSSIMEPPQNLFPSKKELLRLVAVLAIASFVGLTCHFIASCLNPTTKPFCDNNVDSSQDSVFDFCEPCPQNGECYQGKLECAHGYTKDGNSCIEDGDIKERAKKLSEWVENHLCQAYAAFLCYGTGTVWFCEDDIWDDLAGHKLMENFEPDSIIFMYTKKRAVETIDTLMELRVNPNGNKELKCPDALAEHYKPFTCRIGQWISKHMLLIVPVCLMALGSMFLILKVQRRRYVLIRGEEIYHQVCEILEENALMSKRENGECEPWMVASRLRDHLLLPKERKDPLLWKKVENLVQEDSRIDQHPKLVKGESKVVWEWQVEGSLGSARLRRKGENRKLKLNDSIQEKSGQRHQAAISEPRILVF